MSTAAQIASNHKNAQLSTGPRTPEGKSKSSRNALKLGLFATNDFVLLEDQPLYDALVAEFIQELNPKGPLEQTHALEIIRASWRLQRCAKIESNLADRALETGLETAFDAMEDEKLARIQASVDKARAQASNTLRRATAELRRLQTERQTRIELNLSDPEDLGLVEFPQCLKAVISNQRSKALAHRNNREAHAAFKAHIECEIDKLYVPASEDEDEDKKPAMQQAA